MQFQPLLQFSQSHKACSMQQIPASYPHLAVCSQVVLQIPLRQQGLYESICCWHASFCFQTDNKLLLDTSAFSIYASACTLSMTTYACNDLWAIGMCTSMWQPAIFSEHMAGWAEPVLR